jgi:hypothetical protein
MAVRSPAIALLLWLALPGHHPAARTLAATLTPLPIDGPVVCPADANAIQACSQLLSLAPELRQHLPLMAEVSPQWAAIVLHWPLLESLAQRPPDGGAATRLLRLLTA